MANKLKCKVHHWIIKDAAGPTSQGTCKHCGDTQDFKNDVYTGRTKGFIPVSLTTGIRGKKLIKEGTK